MAERIKKINEFLKRELSGIILREIDFPSGVFFTITGVETSKDLKESKVFVSVFPEKETSRCLGIIERNIYNLQQILNKRLRIRVVPKIRFVEDKELEEAQKIEEVLKNIDKGDK